MLAMWDPKMCRYPLDCGGPLVPLGLGSDFLTIARSNITFSNALRFELTYIWSTLDWYFNALIFCFGAIIEPARNISSVHVPLLPTQIIQILRHWRLHPIGLL